MQRHMILIVLLCIATLLIGACQQGTPWRTPAPASGPAAAQAPSLPAPHAGATRVTVGVTESIGSLNPYADSIILGYSVWSEVLGCLVTYDTNIHDFAPSLAMSWRVEDPTTWIFDLRRDVTWQDGQPFTAADVVHSITRIKTDPDSKQRGNLEPIAAVQALDHYTVKIITREPTAELLSYLFGVIITSMAQYDQWGPGAINQQPPVGTGPYLLKEFVPDQRLVLAKNPHWWGGPVQGADEVIYQTIGVAEARITALLNGEIQIAQSVPPHMMNRINNSPGTMSAVSDSAEIMFLAMMPRAQPWDSKLVRQAVGYAIDRDAIIQNLLLGQARRLDGPIGPATYAYDPNLEPRYTYDPAKARQLLVAAGYPDGVDVELATPVNVYPQDKEVAEAIAAMLSAVGIRTRLRALEWSTIWPEIQAGRVPFYYLGRGNVLDPGPPLSQYFETGVMPRIGYSNPALDALFTKARAAFRPAERRQLLSQIMSLITDEAPAQFLWTQNGIWGLAKNIDYQPRPNRYIYANEIHVR
jgi:peptide/nickel transport system substrate-binding protein